MGFYVHKALSLGKKEPSTHPTMFGFQFPTSNGENKPRPNVTTSCSRIYVHNPRRTRAVEYKINNPGKLWAAPHKHNQEDSLGFCCCRNLGQVSEAGRCTIYNNVFIHKSSLDSSQAACHRRNSAQKCPAIDSHGRARTRGGAWHVAIER